MKLNERLLNESGIKLTELEVKCLETILGEGSFFEEAGGNENENNTFIGWQIYENEVKGCRGALASLEKKGVIDIYDDEEGVGYYINYGLTFKPEGYHKLLLAENQIK